MIILGEDIMKDKGLSSRRNKTIQLIRRPTNYTLK